MKDELSRFRQERAQRQDEETRRQVLEKLVGLIRQNGHDNEALRRVAAELREEGRPELAAVLERAAGEE